MNTMITIAFNFLRLFLEPANMISLIEPGEPERTWPADSEPRRVGVVSWQLIVAPDQRRPAAVVA
jgi:hypothetical protein